MKRDKRPRYSTVSIDAVKVPTPELGLDSESVRISAFRRGHKLNHRFIRPGIREAIQNGGAWEVNVDGLSGVLADGQSPAAHATSHQNGGADEVSVAGLSGLLADDQNPVAHAADHENGGADEINVDGLTGTLAGAQLVQVLDEGAAIAARPILNFTGAGVDAVDDAGNNRIDIDIPGGSGSPHDLLDGTQNQDTLAAAVSRGSIIVGNSTPAWAKVVLGASGTVLRSNGADAAWGQAVLTTDVTGTLPIANGGTGQTAKTAAMDALSPTSAKGSILVDDGTNVVVQTVGTDGFVLEAASGVTNGIRWSANQGAYKKVETTADVPINSVTDVTVATEDVTTAAADQVKIDAWFVILNNSGATRVYVITIEFDTTTFDIEISTGALATSSTLMHPFHLEAILDIRSSVLAYAMVELNGYLAAGLAGGGDTTMAATHLRGTGCGTTTNDLTGTTTCHLKIRSADATATQTCRVNHFSARKLTPT